MDQSSSTAFRLLSSNDWQAFGVDEVAYIRQVLVKGERGFAIHAADGTPLTVAATEELAIATIRHNDMEPVTVH